MSKPKLAVYWAASCGGCEVSIVNLHERFLQVIETFDFMFCPCLLDTKKKDIEELPDGDIAVTLYNGAVRTSENEEWARLLRLKSKILVAFGACAYGGGLPALADLRDRRSLLDAVYLHNPSIDNPDRIVPAPETRSGPYTLELPEFFNRVRSLSEIVEVDYSVPGCPPESDQVWNAVSALVSGNPHEKGAVTGAGVSSVCDECARTRTDKKIGGFRRVWEFVPDREECLLDQGIPCMGLVTRDGCGGLCPKVNMPCIGCYGPCEGVFDQTAKTVAALGSILDVAPLRAMRDEAEIAARVDEVLDTLPDVAGIAGRFHKAGGLRRLD